MCVCVEAGGGGRTVVSVQYGTVLNDLVCISVCVCVCMCIHMSVRVCVCAFLQFIYNELTY